MKAIFCSGTSGSHVSLPLFFSLSSYSFFHCIIHWGKEELLKLNLVLLLLYNLAWCHHCSNNDVLWHFYFGGGPTNIFSIGTNDF